MKKLYQPLILLAAVTLIATSCNCIEGEGGVVEQNRNISDFNRISLNIGADLYLVQGSHYEMKISAQQNLLDVIKTDKSGSSLKIHVETMCLRPTEPIKIWITLPELTGVKLNGSGKLICDSTFKVNSLDLIINGSGDINMHTVATSVESEINGSGNIFLAGKTKELKAFIRGSGKINAAGLESSQAEANIAGSGDIRVNATDILNAKITGSGSIFYTGEAMLKSKVTGSGEVQKIK
jgi:hypothetical protein